MVSEDVVDLEPRSFSLYPLMVQCLIDCRDAGVEDGLH